MFEYTDRTNFLDLVRPPAGYRLEFGIGTTYSLDFVALTAALLALIDVDCNEVGSAQQVDTLHAITRVSERLRVFVNRGGIAASNHSSRVTILYDRILREVSFAEGMFHPKVWVLHYRPRLIVRQEIPPGVVRVVCASRNLTTHQCWEAFIAWQGTEGTRKVGGRLHSDITTFLRRIVAEDQERLLQVEQLLDVLGRTTFELPRSMQKDAHFLWQWPGGEGLQRYLPNRARRALVVSPFLRNTLLKSIADRVEKMILISTQQELDKIADDAFMARLCDRGNRVYVVQPADTDGELMMDLHAKLFVFEDNEGSHTFLGSANASSSGWQGGNCEAVTACSPGVSIDHFCDRFVFGDTPAVRGKRPLRGWISEYERQAYAEDEHERAVQYLEQLCASLARVTLLATFIREESELRVRIGMTSLPVHQEYEQWESECEIKLALLSHLNSDASLKVFRNAFKEGVIFNDVSTADLTEFFVIEVTHRKQGNQKRFIVKAKTDFSQWREERDAALIRQLVTREHVQSLMQAILFDAASRPSFYSGDGSEGGRHDKQDSLLLSELTVEDVLRSCTEDPSRINEINHLLMAFEMTDLIDEQFRAFWRTFMAAEAEARNG